MSTTFYLEQSNEQCHKFYELTLNDKKVIATFGRIETKGKCKIYLFPTVQEVEQFFIKQKQQKLLKGYSETIKGQRFFRAVHINPRQLQLPFMIYS